MPALRFSCCGVRLEVAYDASLSPALLRSLLPPDSLLTEDPPEHRFSISPQKGDTSLYLVTRAGRRQAPPAPLDISLVVLRKGLAHCVAEFARERTFLHAGVVAWRDRAIVLPGRSHAGKSTLIWALLRAGATYYSDEYAVIDTDVNLHPFPVPVQLRRPDGPQEHIVTDGVATKPIKAKLILFSTYTAGVTWRPRQLAAGETVLKLLRNSVSMRRSPETTLPLLLRVAKDTPAFFGKRGEVEHVINWLLGIDF